MGISCWFPLAPICYGNALPALPSVISLFMLAKVENKHKFHFAACPSPLVPLYIFCYENCQQLGNTYLARTKANSQIRMQGVDRWHILTAARRSAHLGYAHSIYIYIERPPLPSRSPYISERSCETYANCISVSAQKLDTKHSVARAARGARGAGAAAPAPKSMQC